MAWRKRFKGYGRRIRRYGYRRSLSGRRFIAGNTMGSYIPTIAGAAAGYLAPRFHPMQDVAITALAVLPIKLPRMVRRAASGYVLGMLVKGFIAPSSSGSLSQGDFA